VRKFLVYFRLQLKRALKALPAVIATVLVILCCVLLLFVLVRKADDSRDENEPLKIGIVGDIDDKFFSVGLSAMKHLDSSRFAVELLELTEDEAVRLVNEGEISGYAIIPEGFVASVMTGENKQITLVTTNASEDIMTRLVREFMEEISGYLCETQNSIYGMQQYLIDIGRQDLINGSINDINVFYVNLVMKRDTLFEPVKIVNEGNAVSSNAGYICGLMIFLVMMFGITYSPVYTRRDTSLNSVLRLKSVGIPFQILAEYLSYLCVMLLCLLPLIAATVYGIYRAGVDVPEWRMGFFADYRYFILGFIPVIAMFAAAQYMLFLAADNFIAGISLQFMSAIVLAYLGGCLYPLSFFPEIIRKTAGLQPAGLSYGYLADILLVNDTGRHLTMMLAYLFAFLAASAFILNRRVKNER
jgi:hypothetical protein